MMVVPFCPLPRVTYDQDKEDVERVDIDALLEGSDSEELSTSDEDEVESMSSYAFSDDSHEDVDEDAGKEFGTLRRASLQSLGERKMEPEVGNASGEVPPAPQTIRSRTVTIRSPTARSGTANEATNMETATTGGESFGGKTVGTSLSSQRSSKFSCIGRCFRSIKNSIRRSENYRNFQSWRRRHARERRQEIIKYYEKKVLEEDAKRYAAFEEEFLEHERCAAIMTHITWYRLLLRTAKRLKKLQRHHYRTTRIRQYVATRLVNEYAARKKKSARLEYNTRMFQKWAIDDYARAEEAKKEVARAAASQLEVRTKRSEREMAKMLRIADAKILAEDKHMTQEIYASMRRNGDQPGVNAAKHVKKIRPTKELDKVLSLRLSDSTDFATYKPKHMRSKDTATVFNVDIKKYRQLEHLICENIGERGVMVLAAEFVRGACSNMIALDLTRCCIQTRGLARLLQGLRFGRIINLHTLILRANSICPRGMQFLRMAIDSKGFENLRVIDLRENEVGDVGASTLAQMIVNDSLNFVEELYLQKNNISDKGFEQVIKVLQSVHHVKCCNLMRLAMEENRVTAKMKRKYAPLPPCLSV